MVVSCGVSHCCQVELVIVVSCGDGGPAGVSDGDCLVKQSLVRWWVESVIMSLGHMCCSCEVVRDETRFDWRSYRTHTGLG